MSAPSRAPQVHLPCDQNEPDPAEAERRLVRYLASQRADMPEPANTDTPG